MRGTHECDTIIGKSHAIQTLHHYKSVDFTFE